MRLARAALVCVAVCASTPVGNAEPWYRGPHGRSRVLHFSVTVAGGLAYVASETVLKPPLAADTCRWCDPPSFDAKIRNALMWDDVQAARMWSNLTGYVAAPALGLTVAALMGVGEEGSWARLIDDTVPILETVVISQLVTQAVKFSFGRQRPFVHYADPPVTPSNDDNMSFYSGHAALGFGVVTSAGMIARWRGSRTEPLIWGAGMALATVTSYLRIAGDKHYFSDVATGAIVGVVAGLTIPLLMRRAPNLAITASPRTASLTGTF
jgi:membrane-associated phospholipid phosphatase